MLAAVVATLASQLPATLASFTSSTFSPNNSFAFLEVQPATLTSASSLTAGVVRLSWSGSATASTETVTYAILRRPGGSGAYAQIATASGLTYDDVPRPDGSYDYVIRAIVTTFTRDSNGMSALSDATAPSLSVTCNGGACVAWYTSSITVVATASDGGTGVQTVRTTLDGVTRNTASSTVTTTVSGDGSHTFSALAIDNADNASPTQTYVIGIDGTAPTAPTGLTASAQSANGTVNLAWTAGTDATSGVSGYTVRYVQATACPAPNETSYPSARAVGAVTSTIVDGLLRAKWYCFYLVTVDNAGNQSGPSTIATVKTK